MHGHGAHRMHVGARVVDAETGRPVPNAEVFVMPFPARPNDAWKREIVRDAQAAGDDGPSIGRGSLAVTDADGKVVVPASRTHTVWFWGGSISTWEASRLPRRVVIEHPDYVETTYAIDPEQPITEIRSQEEYRIELGSLAIRRKR
ncbi:MAG: hypothetical protein AAGD14_10900 [Planctomycetota bacterium]